ncbi:hypothetical protein BA899_05110 [Spiribacter sp. SSL99]|nr:hypothetical protein BA899_05110 [Spiribacter sp. SSL99]
MKHAPKLALLVAAGMASAGAQAADFEVSENTTLTLGGEVVLNYLYEKKADGDNSTDFVDDGSLVLLGGSRDLGNGVTAFAEAEFEYNVLGQGDGNVSRGASILGFAGDFGEVAIGDVDNVFEDLITDAVDPFENASLSDSTRTPEDSMIAYYSPDMDGFSFRLQGRHKNEDANQSNTEVSLVAAAEYDFGPIALAAAYDSRGSIDDDGGTDTNDQFNSQDHLVGISAVAQLSDRLEVSARFAQENDQAGNDKDFTAVAFSYNYGAGDVYGAAQSFDPSNGSSKSEVAAGVNYEVASGVLIFAEYGNLDRELSDGDVVADDTDKLGVAGLIYEF